MASREPSVVFKMFVLLIVVCLALALLPFFLLFILWLRTPRERRRAEEYTAAIIDILAREGEMRRLHLLYAVCDRFGERHLLLTSTIVDFVLAALENQDLVEKFSKLADETDVKNGRKPDSLVCWCRLSHGRPQRDGIQIRLRDICHSVLPGFAPQPA
jgi:hypothetical protein